MCTAGFPARAEGPNLREALDRWQAVGTASSVPATVRKLPVAVAGVVFRRVKECVKITLCGRYS